MFCIDTKPSLGIAGKSIQEPGFSETKVRGIVSFIREVFANPLIISCAVGWFLSISGIGVPMIIDDILEIVGRAALPFGILAVGAALNPQTVTGHLKSVLFASIVQFGVKPITVTLIIASLGLTGIPAHVLIIAFITPTASSAYILARQLGGDTEVMASIITFQTVFALGAMPLLYRVL